MTMRPRYPSQGRTECAPAIDVYRNGRFPPYRTGRSMRTRRIDRRRRRRRIRLRAPRMCRANRTLRSRSMLRAKNVLDTQGRPTPFSARSASMEERLGRAGQTKECADPATGTRETPRPRRAARDVGTSIGRRSALARSTGAESAPRFSGLGRRDLGSGRHPLAIAQRLEEGGVRHAAVRLDIENAQQTERRDR